MDVEDLVTAEDIAHRLAVKRPLVHYWRTDVEGFPAPLAKLGDIEKEDEHGRPTGKRSKGIYVWSWPEIVRWAKKNGRLDANGQPVNQRADG